MRVDINDLNLYFAILYKMVKRIKMTITLNIHNEQLFDKILWFLNRFKDEGLEIITHPTKGTPKQDKEVKNRFSEFAGIWKERDITQESLREKAWK